MTDKISAATLWSLFSLYQKASLTPDETGAKTALEEATGTTKGDRTDKVVAGKGKDDVKKLTDALKKIGLSEAQAQALIKALENGKIEAGEVEDAAAAYFTSPVGLAADGLSAAEIKELGEKKDALTKEEFAHLLSILADPGKRSQVTANIANPAALLALGLTPHEIAVISDQQVETKEAPADAALTDPITLATFAQADAVDLYSFYLSALEAALNVTNIPALVPTLTSIKLHNSNEVLGAKLGKNGITRERFLEGLKPAVREVAGRILNNINFKNPADTLNAYALMVVSATLVVLSQAAVGSEPKLEVGVTSTSTAEDVFDAFKSNLEVRNGDLKGKVNFEQVLGAEQAAQTKIARSDSKAAAAPDVLAEFQRDALNLLQTWASTPGKFFEYYTETFLNGPYALLLNREEVRATVIKAFQAAGQYHLAYWKMCKSEDTDEQEWLRKMLDTGTALGLARVGAQYDPIISNWAFLSVSNPDQIDALPERKAIIEHGSSAELAILIFQRTQDPGLKADLLEKLIPILLATPELAARWKPAVRAMWESLPEGVVKARRLSEMLPYYSNAESEIIEMAATLDKERGRQILLDGFEQTSGLLKRQGDKDKKFAYLRKLEKSTQQYPDTTPVFSTPECDAMLTLVRPVRAASGSLQDHLATLHYAHKKIILNNQQPTGAELGIIIGAITDFTATDTGTRVIFTSITKAEALAALDVLIAGMDDAVKDGTAATRASLTWKKAVNDAMGNTAGGNAKVRTDRAVARADQGEATSPQGLKSKLIEIRRQVQAAPDAAFATE